MTGVQFSFFISQPVFDSVCDSPRFFVIRRLQLTFEWKLASQYKWLENPRLENRIFLILIISRSGSDLSFCFYND